MATELEVSCARCGGRAMRIVTTAVGDPLDMPHGRPADEPGWLADADGILTEIDGSAAWVAASAVLGGLEAVRVAMLAGDMEALVRLDPELVPLYCPTCGVSYCRAHWTLRDEFDPDDPGWYDQTLGRCPLDHERRVFD